MVEKVNDNHLYVFDVILWFFHDGEPDYDWVQSQLELSVLENAKQPRVFSSSATFDFDSDYSSDKPGWLERVTQLSDEEVFWSVGGETRWAASDEAMQKYSTNDRSNLWVFFGRVALEVDIEYEWDFEDENAFADIDSKIHGTVFRCIGLGLGTLQASEYVIQPYESL